MYSLEELQDKVTTIIESKKFEKQPLSLYEPIEYAMHQGGKRIRPLLVFLAANMFTDDLEEAEYPAIAVELLHNFTLVHDDIMDLSPLRRGKPTVYQKYGINKAILSGDVIYAMAYEQLMNCSEEKIPFLVKTITSVLIKVCEGQAYDMSFETRNDVSIQEYITMISLKTSILLAGSLKMGAIVANASKENMNILSEVGLYLGIAFQLQDDILDCWSDLKDFGKVSGTDIADNKKTVLYLSALDKASEQDRHRLIDLYTEKNIDVQKKIAEVRGLFEKYEVRKDVEFLIKQYSEKAIESVEKIDVEGERKQNLINLIHKLLKRNR